MSLPNFTRDMKTEVSIEPSQRSDCVFNVNCPHTGSRRDHLSTCDNWHSDRR